MKTLMKHASLVALSLALFPACSKKHNDPAPQPVVVPPPSVVGDYNAAFVTDAASGASTLCYSGSLTQGSLSITMSYKEDNAAQTKRVIQTITNYEDKNCQTAKYEVAATFNYRLEAVEDANHVLQIDYQLAQDGAGQTGVQLRPAKDMLAFDWNRGRGHCGRSDWAAGQQRTVDPTMQGCLEDATVAFLLAPDSREFDTRVRVTDAGLLLYQANGADTGAAGHRASKQDNSVVYVKAGTQPLQPANPGTQPGQPDLTAQCPVFAASYMCDINGDDDFNGRDLLVTKAGAEYKMEAKPVNGLSLMLDYLVDGREHAMPSQPGVTGVQSASCADGKLLVRNTVTGINSPGKFIQDRQYRVLKNGDGSSTLWIDTQNTTKMDDHSNPTVVAKRISCRQM
jgi:hypothetical protein